MSFDHPLAPDSEAQPLSHSASHERDGRLKNYPRGNLLPRSIDSYLVVSKALCWMEVKHKHQVDYTLKHYHFVSFFFPTHKLLKIEICVAKNRNLTTNRNIAENRNITKIKILLTIQDSLKLQIHEKQL